MDFPLPGLGESGGSARDIARPETPTGRADVRGERLVHRGGKVLATGSYAGQDITLRYDDFHAKDVSTRGNCASTTRGWRFRTSSGGLGRHG